MWTQAPDSGAGIAARNLVRCCTPLPSLPLVVYPRVRFMWVLDNQTPYAAERNWVRDAQGRHHWVVAVKATFDIEPRGRLTLADEQPPPALEPVYRGEPGASSLRWDSDLLYIKPTTDVIAEAHAHAPSGRPRPRVEVALHVGPIHKELVVYGNRVYHDAFGRGSTSSPVPFVEQPIIYELAFGGSDVTHPDPSRQRIDLRNPVGRGVAAQGTSLAYQPAHLIEFSNQDSSRAGPAGFGPIDPAWSPRRELAGTYDATWVASRKPLLPADYDPLHGSSAPADQRSRIPLRGGEPVELRGLTPDGLLQFQLPKIYLAYTTYFGTRRQEHRGHLATVLLRPQARQVSLVWQTTLHVLPRDGDYLDETRIVEKPYISR